MDIFVPEGEAVYGSTTSEIAWPIEIDDAQLAMIGGGIGDVVPA